MDIQHSPRLHVVNDLAQSHPLTLTGDQEHYLLHVMRMKVGDELRLFNGRDGEWHSHITAITKKSANIMLRTQLKPQSITPDLWLCCAPIKKAHFEYMIEKATELGVSHIKPVLTARTQIREVNIERCTLIATEAAEQSERMNIPKIEKPITLTVGAQMWPEDRALIVCAEFGEALPLEQALTTPALRNATKTAILTGPEGGFAPDEMEKVRTIKNAIFVRLGPRILRADTAAISAISCWQALCGDWTQQ